MHNGSPDVVNELFLDELLAIVNGIEHFTNGQRCSGVLTNEAKAFLQLRRNWIFEPEQMKRFEAFSGSRRLDGREAMVCIVQQMNIRPEFFAQPLE